jgi:hypothetical protein
MSSTRRTTRLFGLAVTCAALAFAKPAVTVAQNVRQQSSQITRGDLAEQLGAKMTSSQNEELGVGSSLTATLVEPAKLAKLGISGMHEGARVSVMRVAPDKLRVEVDEMEPTPLTKKATLKIDEKGRLAPSAS